MRNVGFKIRTYKKLEKNQADQLPIFRYLIEKISAWSFLQISFLNAVFTVLVFREVGKYLPKHFFSEIKVNIPFRK